MKTVETLRWFKCEKGAVVLRNSFRHCGIDGIDGSVSHAHSLF